MRTSVLFPSNLDPFVFTVGLRGESRINRRPPRSSFHPPQYTVVANSGGGVKDDSAPPSGGVGSSRWKELIEVASPISGRELDPTLPPLVPRPTLPSNHTLPSGGGPCWTPPAAPGRRLGLLPPGRVVHLWSSQIRTWTGMFAWGRGACRACVAFLGHHLS